METTQIFKKNTIIIDASYLNHVAFDLTVNFERMLERRIDKADLPTLLDCMALDGGLKPGENEIQVIFIYQKNTGYDCLNPSDMAGLDGKAFKSNMGEFTIQAVPLEEKLTTMNAFFADITTLAVESEKNETLVLVPNTDEGGHEVTRVLKNAKKQTTILCMNPLHGTGFACEVLGYSLMQAMRIRSEELMNG